MGLTYIRLKGCPSSEEQRWPCQLSHEHVPVKVLSNISSVDLIGKGVSYSGKSDIVLIIQLSGVEGVGIEVLAVGIISVKLIYCTR